MSIDLGGAKQGIRNTKHQTEPGSAQAKLKSLQHKPGTNSAYLDLIQAMVQPPTKHSYYTNLRTVTHTELPSSLVTVSLLNQTDAHDKLSYL